MRIIYKNTDTSIAVLIPAIEILDVVGLAAIAEKDVPQDLPYWLALDTDIPTDRTSRDAWEIDAAMGDPDGFGGVSSEFTDAQLTKLYKAGAVT